jgi:hypothetical protein
LSYRKRRRRRRRRREKEGGREREKGQAHTQAASVLQLACGVISAVAESMVRASTHAGSICSPAGESSTA